MTTNKYIKYEMCTNAWRSHCVHSILVRASSWILPLSFTYDKANVNCSTYPSTCVKHVSPRETLTFMKVGFWRGLQQISKYDASFVRLFPLVLSMTSSTNISTLCLTSLKKYKVLRCPLSHGVIKKTVRALIGCFSMTSSQNG